MTWPWARRNVRQGQRLRATAARAAGRISAWGSDVLPEHRARNKARRRCPCSMEMSHAWICSFLPSNLLGKHADGTDGQFIRSLRTKAEP